MWDKNSVKKGLFLCAFHSSKTLKCGLSSSGMSGRKRYSKWSNGKDHPPTKKLGVQPSALLNQAAPNFSSQVRFILN